MLDKPDQAAAEGLPNDRLKPLLDTPDFTAMRGHQWSAVYDALDMAADVLSGIQDQPRCGDDKSYNAAGEYLGQIIEFLHTELDRLAATLREITPDDSTESYIRASLLIRYATQIQDLPMPEIAAMALGFHNAKH